MRIEARDQLAYSLATLQSGFMSRLRKGLASRHRYHGFGSAYHIQPLAARFDQPLQCSRFLLTQRPQGLFLGLCHGSSPSLTAPVYHFHDPTAMYLLADPLVQVRATLEDEY